MEFSRTGVILYTENYDRCVEFYSGVLALPILFALDNPHSKLTCCNLGAGNYLMIETEGTAVPAGKSLGQSPVWLRFNVSDFDASVKQLRNTGVTVTVRREVWGTVADFTDPDGNRCSLRDEASFIPPPCGPET